MSDEQERIATDGEARKDAERLRSPDEARRENVN